MNIGKLVLLFSVLLLLVALAVALTAVFFAPGARAQVIGGDASISATGTTASVALPANTHTYPAVIIAPAAGTTVEIFFALGSSSVTETRNRP
jgi:hypothetical protein